jgi:hypothetical protein
VFNLKIKEMFATKLLRVNSRYRTPGSASCTDFSVNIASRDLEGISSVVLLSASIPRQFGNVWSWGNVLYTQVTENGEPPQPLNIVIPPGLYTGKTLADKIASIVDPLFNLSISFDEVKKVFHFSVGEVPPGFQMLISSNGLLAQTCGITSDIMLVAGDQLDAPSQTSLQGVSQVYIESTFVANRACLDILENGLSIPLFAVVPCGLVPEGYVINYEAKTDLWQIDYNVEGTGYANLRTIDVRICDTYGNVLTLPPNEHVDLVFRVTKAL